MSVFREQAARVDPSVAVRGGLVRPESGTEESKIALIRRLPVRHRVWALGAVLRVCSPGEADLFAAELVEVLAKRRRRDVAEAVAGVFWRLPSHAQSAAVCVAREALVGAAGGLDVKDWLSRCSVAALAGATGAPALTGRLAEMLNDADAQVADAAEVAVTELAGAVARAGDASTAEIESVVLEAIAGFDRHRRKGVLLAGLKLLGTPTGLARATASRAEWLGDGTHSAQLAIRGLLRRREDPAIASAALVWLRVPAQASACRERLLAAGSVAEHEAVLRLAHLMTHPARARAMSAKAAEGAWEVHLPSFAELSEEARRQTPRWIAALRLGASAGAAQVSGLAGDPSAMVRLGVMVHTMDLAEGDLIDLAYDEDAAVARSAAVRLIERGRVGAARRSGAGDGGAAVQKLARSPHAGVRAVCRAAAGDEHGPAGRMAWRLALRRDRAGALAELRDRVLMGPEAARAAWVRTVRCLGLAGEMERELCELVEENGAGVLAATAVAVLGECAGKRAGEALEAALGSADRRVCANAIEAMVVRAARGGGGREREVAARLVEFKDDAGHRVRANAALARLVLGDCGDEQAGSEVRRLLDDERAAHRLAGVWLAERAAGRGVVEAGGLIEHVGRLGEDADAGVRERAVRCAARLKVMAGATEVAA